MHTGDTIPSRNEMTDTAKDTRLGGLRHAPWNRDDAPVAIAVGDERPTTGFTNPGCRDFAGWEPCGFWTSSVTRPFVTGFTNPSRTETSPNAQVVTPEEYSEMSRAADRNRRTESANVMLKDTGSCVVQLANGVLLHVLHVNTVGNQKFNATVFSERHKRYARLQSNTTKTRRLSRLRFVSDKKRLSSQHGYKNTRIEFSSNPSRSANYTSNAKHLLQSYFRSVFDTISLTQGTCVTSAKAFTVSNENLTCYIYGVANPLTVVIRMKNTKTHFHTPFFFSSVNVAGKKNRHQLFSSMSINSQRVKDVTEELPHALDKVAKLIDIHVHLNRLCCELTQERRGMLTAKEKLCLVYLTELHFLDVIDRSHPRHWDEYSGTVKRVFLERHRSKLSAFQDKVLTNYHLKNPEFIHIVPWLLDNPSRLHDKMLTSHEAYLRAENKNTARVELIATVAVSVERDPSRRVPRGFPSLRDVEFRDLGYTSQTLTNAIRNARLSKVARPYGSTEL